MLLTELHPGGMTEEQARRWQANLERIRRFRLMDDDFMTKCFEDNIPCTELMLRIILEEPELVVEEVRTQVFVENLQHRSVRMDVVAVDGLGRRINVEVQRSDRGAGRRRARYNSSMMDAGLLEKSQEFEALPETYVIFITERDVMGGGLPLYHVERRVRETGLDFADGAHILYVNGACRDASPVGRLMHDFSCADPSQMYYGVLAERTRFFKEEKEGVVTMCRIMEEVMNEGRQEGLREGLQEGRQERAVQTVRTLLKLGKLALDEIALASGLSIDEVKRLSLEQK